MKRFQLRNLRKQLDNQFAEAYWQSMNAVDGAALCFVSLGGKRVIVQNGRRLELKGE